MPVPRFMGGVLCAVASLTLLLCALNLCARESVGAGVFLALIAFALLFSAMKSLRAGGRE